jgi:hypothetical protein
MEWIPMTNLILTGLYVVAYFWVEFGRRWCRSRAEHRAALLTLEAHEAAEKQGLAPEQAAPIAPLEELAFGLYPAQDELTRTFRPGLLRYGILIRNGVRTQEIFDYWTEDENEKRTTFFLTNKHLLPKRLLPDERYIFQYTKGIISDRHPKPKLLRACVQLDGPKGGVIKSSFTPIPKLSQ